MLSEFPSLSSPQQPQHTAAVKATRRPPLPHGSAAVPHSHPHSFRTADRRTASVMQRVMSKLGNNPETMRTLATIRASMQREVAQNIQTTSGQPLQSGIGLQVDITA